ncbi:MAG: hypothetical protein JO050_00795, partial [Acidimicrobiia bacterium]|nr:hypothetical protein [Acidimicrobiia bacterium]
SRLGVGSRFAFTLPRWHEVETTEAIIDEPATGDDTTIDGTTIDGTTIDVPANS